MSGVEGIGSFGDINREFQRMPDSKGPHGDLKSGVSVQGEQAYVDLAQSAWALFGPGIDWQKSPPAINTTLLDDRKTAFAQMFANMKQEGVNEIHLSFAQLCDINRLCKDAGVSGSFPNSTGLYSSNDSAMYQVMRSQNTANPPQYTNPAYQVVDGSGKEVASNFLQYFCQYAHQNNMKISLSFGGADAAGADDKFPDTPENTAKNLASVMKTLGVDNADFDIENDSLFTQNQPADVEAFFTALHSDLQAQGMTSSATVEGGSVTDPKFAPLLDNFSAKFDDANLMLYSNTQYWLDPTYIKGLISHLEIDASQVHIGFYSSINYSDASSCASGQTPPCTPDPTKSSGTNAANMFKALQNDIPGLGDAFIWNDDPTSTKSYNFMQDFYNGLKGISRTPWS